MAAFAPKPLVCHHRALPLLQPDLPARENTEGMTDPFPWDQHSLPGEVGGGSAAPPPEGRLALKRPLHWGRTVRVTPHVSPEALTLIKSTGPSRNVMRHGGGVWKEAFPGDPDGEAVPTSLQEQERTPGGDRKHFAFCLNPFLGEGNSGGQDTFFLPGTQGLCGSRNALPSAQLQAKRK